MNLAPLIVIVLAYLILKEEIRKFDLLIMLLTLAGVIAVILGGNAKAADDSVVPAVPYFVLYIMLMLVPFLSAGGVIAMRQMKKFNASVVSWYL